MFIFLKQNALLEKISINPLLDGRNCRKKLQEKMFESLNEVNDVSPECSYMVLEVSFWRDFEIYPEMSQYSLEQNFIFHL